MRCQRRILSIRWFDGVTNEAVVQQTGSEDIRNIIAGRRHSLFDHVRASRTTHPPISPYILPSTCVADISPVSNGLVSGVVHGAPGYINWRWTRELRLMNCGTQHPIDGLSGSTTPRRFRRMMMMMMMMMYLTVLLRFNFLCIPVYLTVLLRLGFYVYQCILLCS